MCIPVVFFNPILFHSLMVHLQYNRGNTLFQTHLSSFCCMNKHFNSYIFQDVPLIEYLLEISVRLNRYEVSPLLPPVLIYVISLLFTSMFYIHKCLRFSSCPHSLNCNLSFPSQISGQGRGGICLSQCLMMHIHK